MAKALRAETIEATDYEEAMETIYREGWTDGQPVVIPTEELVRRILDYVELEPDAVVAEQRERGKAITAEVLAINAVMAGCLPEYMPVVIAAVEAVLDPDFHFNHTASLASPWPLLIVSGPIVDELGFNGGAYVFGPSSRANAAVGRALSLMAWNCLDARPGIWTRGQVGHPGRWGFCIAELQNTGWTPLHVQLGYPSEASTVTAFPSLSPPCQYRAQWRTPEALLDHICAHLAHHSGNWGYYIATINPYHLAMFLECGWSKEDVTRYIKEHTKTSVAELKIRGRWGGGGQLGIDRPPITPEDMATYVPLFTEEPDRWPLLYHEGSRFRKYGAGLYVLVAGGDAGTWMSIVQSYGSATNPITKPIRLKGK